MSDRFKIELGAAKLPASFIAYDCLQVGDRILLDVPLMERKGILADLIAEDGRFAVSRFIPEKGINLFQMTVQQELEGVVAKRKNSLYHMGKRTRDWIKFKWMADEDFVICGYVSGKMPSLILGEVVSGELKYAGTVTMGVRREDLKYLKKGACPLKDRPKEKAEIVWCIPEMVCTVEYMPNTKDALRQPVFKGIRSDVMNQFCYCEPLNKQE